MSWDIGNVIDAWQNLHYLYHIDDLGQAGLENINQGNNQKHTIEATESDFACQIVLPLAAQLAYDDIVNEWLWGIVYLSVVEQLHLHAPICGMQLDILRRSNHENMENDEPL